MSSKGGTILSNLYRVKLTLELLKTHQLVDYSTTHLSSDVAQHAALDALVSRRLCEHFQFLVENNELFEDDEEG